MVGPFIIVGSMPSDPTLFQRLLCYSTSAVEEERIDSRNHHTTIASFLQFKLGTHTRNRAYVVAEADG